MCAKKTVTPKQLAANRRNALKSTGPKTLLGKRISAKNALRHGLLSRELLVMVGDGKEDPADFEELLRGLHDHHHPEGKLEELLVDRIASCWWRLRRAVRAETGEIRKHLDSATSAMHEQRASAFRTAKSLGPMLDDGGTTIRQGSLGVEFLIALWEKAQRELEYKSEISKTTQDALYKHFGRDRSSPAIMCHVLSEDLDQERASGLAGEAQESISSFIKDEIKNLKSLLRVKEGQENLQIEANLLSLSVPGGHEHDRIIRYEMMIERQLYRALDQLERLQRRRQGDAVPAPARLSIET